MSLGPVRPRSHLNICAGGAGAELFTPSGDLPPQLLFDHAGELLRYLSQPHQLLLSAEAAIPPTDVQLSRFVAKMALGYIASCLVGIPGGLDYLVDEGNRDPLRNHARRGGTLKWPVSVRRIYCSDAKWLEDGQHVQRVWEAMLLQDDRDYQYFVIALFGWEFAMHIGEPDISGYRRWLLLRGGVSPLYDGRHTDSWSRLDQHHTRTRRSVLLGYRYPDP